MQCCFIIEAGTAMEYQSFNIILPGRVSKERFLYFSRSTSDKKKRKEGKRLPSDLNPNLRIGDKGNIFLSFFQSIKPDRPTC